MSDRRKLNSLIVMSGLCNDPLENWPTLDTLQKQKLTNQQKTQEMQNQRKKGRPAVTVHDFFV